MFGQRRFFFRFLVATVVIFSALFLTRAWWLAALGRALVRNDGPAKADIVVVLAGDQFGHRIEKGAELVRAGYAPLVLVSGPGSFYGNYESDLAIAFIVRHGYPAEWFVPVTHCSRSTKEEAVVLLRELQRRNVHRFLLVTSDYHTGRAGRIFTAAERDIGYTPEMRLVAAPDEFFRADSWWHSREGEKTAFNEWAKTLAWNLGL